MELRVATEKDKGIIQKLRISMLEEIAGKLPDNLPREISRYLDTNLRNGNCLCVLLFKDNDVIGKAMLCIYEVMPDERNITGKCATLFSVYTRPEHRGQGYMEKLLTYLLEKAKERGIKEVLAFAEEKAIPLYERIGFTMKNNAMRLQL